MNKKLLLIVLFGLGVRLSFYFALQPWNQQSLSTIVFTNDAPEYNKLALQLLSERSFKNFNNFRTPGYPVFLAILYRITNNSIAIVFIIQLLLNSLVIIMVYKLANLLFSEAAALIAALLFAMDLHQAVYSISLLTETLFVFIFILSTYLFCRGLMKRNLSNFIISGALLGLATLIRPVSFLFPVIPTIFILLFYNVIKKSDKIRFIFTYFLSSFIILLPWMLFNFNP